jgi:hypothetical protein
LLETLISGPVTSFRTGIDPIEDLEPVFKNRTQSLEVFLPVRILDKELYSGIYIIVGANKSLNPLEDFQQESPELTYAVDIDPFVR